MESIALDNVYVRLYVDQGCFYFQKLLLETGALGVKCNTQMVIPHLTENYGTSRNPPKKQAPCARCTLSHKILTIAWHGLNPSLRVCLRKHQQKRIHFCLIQLNMHLQWRMWNFGNTRAHHLTTSTRQMIWKLHASISSRHFQSPPCTPLCSPYHLHPSSHLLLSFDFAVGWDL